MGDIHTTARGTTRRSRTLSQLVRPLPPRACSVEAPR